MAVLLSTTNKMAKTIVLNPTRMNSQDKPDNLVQFNKAQLQIRAMYQLALIGKALNHTIWKIMFRT
eukprot:974357-Ditylum_brightwellii.AAC.1